MKGYHICWFVKTTGNTKVYADGVFNLDFRETSLNDLREHLFNITLEESGECLSVLDGSSVTITSLTII